jgi:hypothetical protein
MDVHPQVQEEIISSRYSHLCVIRAGDLTDTVDAEAQTLTLFSLPTGAQVRHVQVQLPTAFQNTGEAGNDTTTVQIGTDDDDDNFITATQINANSGSPAIFPIYDTGDALPTKIAAAHPNVVATFTPKSATKLSELNEGVLFIFFDIFVPSTGI